MAKKRAILFDSDGTLIDSTEAILESFGVAFEKFGKNPPNPTQITSLVGHPLDYMFASLGVENEIVWDYVGAYKEHYRVISKEKTKLLDGAKEAVLDAWEFAKLGIVTTKTSRFSIELFEHFELLKYFEIVIGREDVENPKPHPEPILKAIEKIGVQKHQTWMIGDTPLDLLSAKEAGVFGIGVTCGYGQREELAKYSNLIENSAKEAVDSILQTKV